MKYIKAVFYYTWKLYIGIAFVTTLLLFYPVLFVCLSVPSWKSYSFPINIVWSRVMRILCLVAVKTHGKAQVPNEPYIIVANHTSYFDIFLMYSILPQRKFLFMGKSEILNYPLVKTFFKRLNIPVFRGDRLKAAKAFIRAKKEIQDGWSIVIFPEGKIPDETPYLNPFKEGAFKLAQSANIGILPLTFSSNYYLFSDPEDVFGSARPGISHVHFHTFIPKEKVSELHHTELKELVFDSINRPLPKPS